MTTELANRQNDRDGVDEILEELIGEVESVYGQAYEELKAEAETYLEEFKELDEKKAEQVKAGLLSAGEYKDWRISHILTGRTMYAKLDAIANNLANTNLIALSIINGYMPYVYATSGNWAIYDVEHSTKINTGFTLYNESAIEKIIREHPDLLPRKKLNIPKDKLWNKQLINNAIMQGIIQGDNVEQIADRLAAVTDMNRNHALTNAVTMTTSAQSGGRVDTYRRAMDMGIKMKGNAWIATLDGHTRTSHRKQDNMIVPIGKKFPNGLTRPGDPSGRPEEVYGCRCTIVAVYDDQDLSKIERNSRLGDMSYEEWKNAKGDEPLFWKARNVNRDMKMHDEYRDLLGSKVPKSFKDFQDFKYGQRAEWRNMISDARKARNRRRKESG